MRRRVPGLHESDPDEQDRRDRKDDTTVRQPAIRRADGARFEGESHVFQYEVATRLDVFRGQEGPGPATFARIAARARSTASGTWPRAW
jgi:hypothetical protein